ncbi:HNH endonuclease [Candidatus Poriferisodalis sp.]|uniref:HNH endonuclease signature motif containing protein n=1 Tax=Candidatus Poriferisodalis sp. TaxID=3101277 RepID=UPI003B02866C
MFSELLREPAPGADVAIDEDGFADGHSAFRTTPVWPVAEPAWPSESTTWSGGPFGRTADATAPSGGAAGSPPRICCDVGARGAEGADLSSLADGALKALMVQLAAERARVEGRYLAVVSEFATRNGAQSAAYVLRDQARLNCSQARSEARLGETLAAEGLTDTIKALQTGDVTVSHARVIAREAPKPHRRSESDFLELCRAYPSDVVARHPFAYQSQQVWDDLAAEAAAKGLSPVDVEMALQREQRRGSMHRGDDGMWVLRAKFDAITGRHVSVALQAAVRTARNRQHTNRVDAGTAGDGDCLGGNDAALTRAQLTADAVANLIAGESPTRRTNTTLMVIADYDLVDSKLARPRLDDGTPLSARLLAEHAVDAKVLPAVFSADWKQLALGRSRNASDAQRLVLAARDQGCIGCQLTCEHTQAHHICHHEHGGLTEIDNLALLCEPCHRHLHQHHRTITIGPNGKPQLQPPQTDPPPNNRPSTHPPPDHEQADFSGAPPNGPPPASAPKSDESGRPEHSPPTAAVPAHTSGSRASRLLGGAAEWPTPSQRTRVRRLRSARAQPADCSSPSTQHLNTASRSMVAAVLPARLSQARRARQFRPARKAKDRIKFGASGASRLGLRWQVLKPVAGGSLPLRHRR